MNLDLLISLSRSQMFKFPESCMAMKEDARGASLTDGRQATQQCLLTDSETGNALEKLDGKPLKMKGRISRLFSLSIIFGFSVGIPFHRLLNSVNVNSFPSLRICF